MNDVSFEIISNKKIQFWMIEIYQDDLSCRVLFNKKIRIKIQNSIWEDSANLIGWIKIR